MIKINNKQKALVLSFVLAALLLPTTLRAQAYDKEAAESYNGGAFYELIAYDTYLDELANVLKAVELNRGSASISGGSITNDDFGTSPLGSGLGILIAAGAGYAALRRKRSRKNTTLLLACVLLLGFTQCKKEQIEPQGGKVNITLNVENGGKATDGARADVTPPSVTFKNGDRILVAYDGKYVGYLDHNGSNFSGTIDATGDNTKPLYFYFLGNCVNVDVLDAGLSTSCEAVISDQTGYPTLPVISFSASNENYNGAGTYTASLHNKASLMKFNVTTPSTSPICITGMNNKVTVNFADRSTNDGFSYSKDSEGVIKMQGGSGSPAVKWAIVLPQDASPAARAYTDNYEYIGTRPAMAAITANQFIETAFEMEVNTEFNPYFTPLTFEAKTADATVTFTIDGIATSPVQYSTDGSTWETYSSETGITLANIGDKVSFRGDNATYATGSGSDQYSKFSCNADCYIYGNVMSLISSTGYAEANELTGNYAFCQLFLNNTNIVNHPSKTLVLPATKLANHCYDQMFRACTSLTMAPELPATELKTYCYYGMFYGCTYLTTAPALPAMTLANNCYSYMFKNCESLIAAPALPATTLADKCYNNMFSGCTSLTTAPALPATMLKDLCYYQMFNNCHNLNNVTCLATNISASSCTTHWLDGVALDGTLNVAAGMRSTWSTSGSVPAGWTIVDPLPGALSGKFTINASGDQVYFSQGNLQATTSDLGEHWSWAFATNQWDYIGNATANTSINGNGTVSANGTVDLFGWVGASSTWTGAAQYGISNSTTTNSTSTYGNNDSEALKSDWGNTIGSGWRTLTKDEWTYVFNTRTVNGGTGSGYSYTKGQSVNSTLGLVIYPDDYTGSEYAGSDWATFEAAGCVFLPAAGLRDGSVVVNYGVIGYYWTSASVLLDAESAYEMYFSGNGLNTCPCGRYRGLSVRLARDAN